MTQTAADDPVSMTQMVEEFKIIDVMEQEVISVCSYGILSYFCSSPRPVAI